MLKYSFIFIFIFLINISFLICEPELFHDSLGTFHTYYGTKENPYYSYFEIPLINNQKDPIYLISNFENNLSENFDCSLSSGRDKLYHSAVKLNNSDTFKICIGLSTFQKVKDSLAIYYETTKANSTFIIRDSFFIKIEANESPNLKIDNYFLDQYMYFYEITPKYSFIESLKIFNYSDEIELLSIESIKNNHFEFLGFSNIKSNTPNINLNLPIKLDKNHFVYTVFRSWIIDFGLNSDSIKFVYKNTNTGILDSEYVKLRMNLHQNKSLNIQDNNFIYQSITKVTKKYPKAIYIYNRFDKDVKINKFTYFDPLESNSLAIKMYNKNLPIIIKPNNVDTVEIDYTPQNVEGQFIGKLNVEYEYNGVSDINFIYIVTQNDSKTDVELSSETPLAIYPNPASSLATLLLNADPLVGEEVQIYNSLGILVSAFEVKEKQTQVNTEKFADGIYLARLLRSGKSVKFSVMR